MEITFTRKKNNNHIISCRRRDETVTWMHCSSFFVLHDLCHFAVESELGLKESFYGMLAAGTDINDFELPKENRTFQLAEEAIFVEHVVNLLMIENNQGKMGDFIEMLSRACQKDEIEFEKISFNQETLFKIKKTFDLLFEQWNSISAGESMKLIFEE